MSARIRPRDTENSWTGKEQTSSKLNLYSLIIYRIHKSTNALLTAYKVYIPSMCEQNYTAIKFIFAHTSFKLSSVLLSIKKDSISS